MMKNVTNRGRSMKFVILTIIAVLMLDMLDINMNTNMNTNLDQLNSIFVQASFGIGGGINLNNLRHRYYHHHHHQEQHNVQRQSPRAFITIPTSSSSTRTDQYQAGRSTGTTTTGALSMGKATAHLLSKQWLPSIDISDDDIFASDLRREKLEEDAIQYLTTLIRSRFGDLQLLRASPKNDENSENDNDIDNTDDTDDEEIDENTDDGEIDESTSSDSDSDSDTDDDTELKEAIREIVTGRFRDLTNTVEGEQILEELFIQNPSLLPSTETENKSNLDNDAMHILRGGVIALQSLLIMGMQVGVKGNQESQERLVSHLFRRSDYSIASSSASSSLISQQHRRKRNEQSLEQYFNNLTSRQLKHQLDVTAGTQLLSSLGRKRSTQSAYDILVQLGIFEKHEDIALLRSGFPLRFTDEEVKAALEAEEYYSSGTGTGTGAVDPDDLLGLRKDLRSMKVYTIDGEYTHEIDDGLSIEKITKEDGSERHRVWIHIADADKWAPRDSAIFQVAQSRATSVYTPAGSISMFPSNLSTGVMSLRADNDSYALSLGVELNDDGSLDEKTIQVTPSIIKVDYRLSYDEVDEMLEMGIGYFEEWELGALLSEANKRRKFRISNGSTEGFVTNPIPQSEIRIERNADAEDGIDIIVKVEATHNAGYNQSSTSFDSNADDYAPPVSSSFLLVTEMMIMSGEAMGKFKALAASTISDNNNDSIPQLENGLDLPFRTQAKPDFSARYQELNNLESLKERGYCHAWYARRFFNPVKVISDLKPHYGLGLDCYVQWSSPIRRFGDLQVHAAVKRFLRKKRVNELMRDGESIPKELTNSDLGCIVPKSINDSVNENGKITEYVVDNMNDKQAADLAMNYKRGLGFIKAARVMQRKSNEYWLFEYIRRSVEKSDNDVEFEGTVLACVDLDRFQYAIYINELGLEHRYLSQQGYLQTGSKLLLKVDSVSPRHGLLTFTLSKKYMGRGASAA